MTWFRIDDKFGESLKVKRIPRAHRMAAVGLWAMAGQWSAGQLTNGRVPVYMVEELGGSTKLAGLLVACGLWEEREDGWQFHDWSDYQPTREQVESKRSAARERMTALRDGSRSVRANGARTSHEVRDTFATPVPNPVPKEKDPSSAGADGAFEEFWDLYPKKINKQAAKRKWATTVKRVEAQDLVAGLRRSVEVWQRERTEHQFIPGPDVWLNKGRWEDEIPDPGDNDETTRNRREREAHLAWCEAQKVAPPRESLPW